MITQEHMLLLLECQHKQSVTPSTRRLAVDEVRWKLVLFGVTVLSLLLPLIPKVLFQKN